MPRLNLPAYPLTIHSARFILLIGVAFATFPGTATGQNTIVESTEPAPNPVAARLSASPTTLTAQPDTLVAAFTGGIFIGNLVFQSGASLTNLLDVPVTITYVRQRNQEGTINAESSFDKALQPGESTGFTISYNFIQPTQAQLADFELEFTVTTPSGQIVHTYKNNRLQSLGLKDVSMDAGRTDTLNVQSVFRFGTTPYAYSIQSSNPTDLNVHLTGTLLALSPTRSGATGVTITATDAAGDSETAHFTLTAEAAPLAVRDTATTEEDAPVVIPVLANDTHPDGAALSISRILTAPTLGTASFLPNAISYTPNADVHGLDSLSYEITDGNRTANAWVLVEITPVNDVPVIATTALSDAREGEPYSFQLSASDADGDVVSFGATGLPVGLSMSTAGLIGGTPGSGTAGLYNVEVSAQDQTSTANLALELIVTPPRPAPVAVADTVMTDEDIPVSFNVLANDLELSGNDVTVSIGSAPTSGSLAHAGDGAMTYTPTADFNGTDSFTYVLNDTRGNTSTATVTIFVTPVNDAPTAQNDTVTVVAGDTTRVDVLANDTDPESDPLTVSLVGPPDVGAAWVDAQHRVVFVAPESFSVSATMDYQATDPGGLSSVATLTVTVTERNRPPSAPAIFLPEPGQPLVLSGTATSRLVFAWTESTDPNGDDITYRWRLLESATSETALRTRHERFPFFETDMSLLLSVVDSLNAGTPGNATLFHSVDAIAGGDTTTTGPIVLQVVRGEFVATEHDALPTAFSVGEPWPNPARGQAFLTIEAPAALDIRLTVYDILGRHVTGTGRTLHMVAGHNRIDVPVGGLSPGTYAIELVREDGSRDVRVLVRW